MPKSETRYCPECRRHTEHLIGPGGNFGCMDEKHPKENAMEDDVSTRLFGDVLYRTYTWDLPLFAELGLTPFGEAPHGVTFEVGRVHLEAGEAIVSVVCFPAQFWTFDIYPAGGTDGQRVRLETGSGALGTYWPIALKFLEGMVKAHVVSEDES